jgi:Flp pilus assembly protein TadD
VGDLPRDATLRLYHGTILADMRRFEAALAEFREAFQLSGGNPTIRLSVAHALGELGRFEEAVREYCQVPPGHPDRPRALRDAAVYLIAHTERRAEACALLRESIQLDPNQPQADLVRQQIAQLESQLRTP